MHGNMNVNFKNMLQLQCCGIEGPKDWDRNNYFNCSSRDVGSREACGVPFSCCKRKPNVSMYWALVYGALHSKTCVSLDMMWFLVLSLFIHLTLRHKHTTAQCSQCMEFPVVLTLSYRSQAWTIWLISFISHQSLLFTNWCAIELL
jgi:hypothetical protein